MLAAQVILGRYELVREIGRGASGTVWAAQDRRLERPVAVKVLHLENAERAAWQARFEREAQTIARLQSPHIVQVYDAGAENDRAVIVMELLEGEGLDARLRRYGHLDLTAAASIVTDLTKALSLTHEKGIVHRDIKPANVFLARQGMRAVAKLLDFGIALRSVEASNEVTAGTPHYMSPEALEHGQADVTSDLWALGVLMYQLITGALPFQGSSEWQLRNAVFAAIFAAPSSLVAGLDADVDGFFRRVFARDPSERFQSADAFASALAELVEARRDDVIRILVIDDEPDMEVLMSQRLRRDVRAGRYELRFARDGASGLEALRDYPDVDVVMTDIRMPGMDGLTFLARAPDVNPWVRVIVVSAYGDMPTIRTAMNRGAFDFLCKPFDFEDLERTLGKCVAQVRTLRRAFASTRENLFMKVMLDTAAADRLLRALQASDRPHREEHDAAVMFVGVADLVEELCETRLSEAVAALNAHYELFTREVLAQHGEAIRVLHGKLFAVFVGPGRVQRAANASLALRDAARRSQTWATKLEFSIGLDVGSIVIASVGSMALGRIDHTVLGPAINGAAALAQRAGAQNVLVSPAVQGALRDGYRLQRERGAASTISDEDPFVLVARFVEQDQPQAAPTVELDAAQLLQDPAQRAPVDSAAGGQQVARDLRA